MYQDDPFTRIPGRVTPDKVSPLGTKWCYNCGKLKPLSEFHIRNVNRAGKSLKIPLAQCKECMGEYQRKYRAKKKPPVGKRAPENTKDK